MGHLEWLQEFGDPVSNQPMGSTKENLNCAIVGEVAPRAPGRPVRAGW
jgi:hypothetical protein